MGAATIRSRGILLAALVFLAGACASDGGGSDARGDELAGRDAGATDAAFDGTSDGLSGDIGLQEFSPAVCGAPDYGWLPATAVGEVVGYEPMTIDEMSTQEIRDILAAQDLEGVIEPSYGVRSFRFRYTTQDRGAPVEATAVVSIPLGLEQGSAAGAVAWLHGTSGFIDECAPSRTLFDAIVPGLLVSSQGHIAVSPDYLGLMGMGDPSPSGTFHHYLVGEPIALTSLDAIRAAAALLRTFDDAPALDLERVVLLGGSQGAHAAFFMELYAPYYAPEIGILGAAMAAAPTDLLGAADVGVEAVNALTVVTAASLVSMASWYRYGGDIREVLVDEPPGNVATRLPAAVAETCDPQDVFTDVGIVDEVFQASFIGAVRDAAWDEALPWACYLRENSVGMGSVARVSNTPFFIVNGEADDLVMAAVERPSLARLCDAGYRIEMIECAGAGHVETLAALDRIVAWVSARLAGEPLENEGCILGSPEPCG